MTMPDESKARTDESGEDTGGALAAESKPETGGEQTEPSAADAVMGAIGDLRDLMAANSAELAALKGQLNALQAQRDVLASTAAEDNGGNATEPDPAADAEPDYPSIDLDSLERTIGDY